MRSFEWPWCPRHDAPYVARRDGLYCPWSDYCGDRRLIALGEEPPSLVKITHTGKPYSRPLHNRGSDASR